MKAGVVNEEARPLCSLVLQQLDTWLASLTTMSSAFRVAKPRVCSPLLRRNVYLDIEIHT